MQDITLPSWKCWREVEETILFTSIMFQFFNCYCITYVFMMFLPSPGILVFIKVNLIIIEQKIRKFFLKNCKIYLMDEAF